MQSFLRSSILTVVRPLESMCDDQETVVANIRSVKITSPDYKNWSPEEAVQDYMSRIKDHERYYQPVDEEDKSYIKIINVSCS